ncbi:S-methyl-5'-thioadenosine phosphorylase [bacterium]|nr:S-methyl-5'-thioadenosine phosphorylase [bacterium]
MTKRIGIIGGSGLYQIDGLNKLEQITLETPYGKPSDVFTLSELEGREVIFLPRHGSGHKLTPSEINYRANIWGMKALGVDRILSVSAVGSFKKELKPTDMIIVDQFVDRTRGRKNTFFEDGLAAHVMFAHPVCERLGKIVAEAASVSGLDDRIHKGGTYLCMEGPAFSTKAESILYKSWNMDIIGMTNITEARLAREAEICFCTLAMVTDYDCWIEGDSEALVNVEMVMGNIKKNIENARKIIRQTILSSSSMSADCTCQSALKNAIITDPECITQDIKDRFKLLAGKYL